jgi:hypothetical protein
MLDQMDILASREFHPTIKEYTFFSAAHGTLSKTGHILGYKVSLKKFKKTEIIPYVISDHYRVKQDHNKNKKKLQKIFKHMENEQHTTERLVSD